MTIMITSKRDGFRRCGIAHSSQSTFYPDDFFTEEQLKALSQEPQLVLAYVEDEFDQEKDGVNETFTQAESPQAPDTLPVAQPQAAETSPAPLGQVDGIRREILDRADSSGANDGNQVGGTVPVTETPSVSSQTSGASESATSQTDDTTNAATDSGQSEVNAEGPPQDNAAPPAVQDTAPDTKAGKTRTAKPKADSK